MTAQTGPPVALTEGSPPPEGSARPPALAVRLFMHGLAVLGVAVMLGVAQTLEMWMGALVLGLLLMLLAGAVALAGLIARLRPYRSTWS